MGLLWFETTGLARSSIRLDGIIGFSNLVARTSESSATSFSGLAAKGGVYYFKKKRYYFGGFLGYHDLLNAYSDDFGGKEYFTMGSLGFGAGLFLDRQGNFFVDVETYYSSVFIDQIGSLTEKHHTYSGAGIRFSSGYIYLMKSFSFQIGPAMEFAVFSQGKDTDYGTDLEDIGVNGISLFINGAFYL